MMNLLGYQFTNKLLVSYSTQKTALARVSEHMSPNHVSTSSILDHDANT